MQATLIALLQGRVGEATVKKRTLAPGMVEENFINAALHRWLKKSGATRQSFVAQACAELSGYYKRFFAQGYLWLGPIPSAKGDWSQKKAVYTAAVVLMMDLADLGLIEARLAAGLGPGDAEPKWTVHAYNATCDFAEALCKAIKNDMLAERAEFRGEAGSVILH